MSFGLIVTLDASHLASLGNRLGAAGDQAPGAMARAINHTGDKARTAMIRSLTAQTGLKRKVIVRALRVTRADRGSLTYTIKSRGGDISLKHFSPRETAKGVSAAPWNSRQVFPSTFMRAGWWPVRVMKSEWNGQVFSRLSSTTDTIKADGRYMDRFHKERSGLFIPEEMLQGETAAAFTRVVDRDLGARLGHELDRILGGA